MSRCLSSERDDCNNQETDGQAAEQEDQNLFRQILRHADRALSKRRLASSYKLYIMKTERDRSPALRSAFMV